MFSAADGGSWAAGAGGGNLAACWGGARFIALPGEHAVSQGPRVGVLGKEVCRLQKRVGGVGRGG